MTWTNWGQFGKTASKGPMNMHALTQAMVICLEDVCHEIEDPCYIWGMKEHDYVMQIMATGGALFSDLCLKSSRTRRLENS